MDRLYSAWEELLGWMRTCAQELGAEFVVEAHFPDAIYRLHRELRLPTTVMSASLAFPETGERFLTASVSPPWARDRGIEVRVVKAHVYLHLHLEEEGLAYEGRPLTERRLCQIAAAAKKGLAPVLEPA